MKVLVCGGRDYFDSGRVFSVLDAMHAETPITCIVHGACCDREGRLTGADRLAEEWARSREVKYVGVPAKWRTGGGSRSAQGPIRNRRMLAEERPDKVVAFPGGRGTADMIAASVAHGFIGKEHDGITILSYSQLPALGRAE